MEKVKVKRVATTDGLTTHFIASINSPKFGHVEAIDGDEPAALETLTVILSQKERNQRS